MKSLSYILFLIPILMQLIGCGGNDNMEVKESNPPLVVSESKPNILLIIADDMGLDATPGYPLEDEFKPIMPNLTELMSTGVRYTNVWSAPLCTPTRATIITGKYGFRTGVVKVGDALNSSELSLHKHLQQSADYRIAVIGKWHLGPTGQETHPNDVGVGHYAGSLPGSVRSYDNWSLTTNGVTVNEQSYVTSKYTDLAIDWIDQQDQPWFLWLAHNAPHDPYEYPPEDLYDASTLPPAGRDFTEDQRKFFAMIQAMDKEIGRLLKSMDEATRENTIVIFIGDNGTGGKVSQTYDPRKAKGSLYQGGINVPMIVSGKGVTKSGSVDNSLIGTVDLFATITEIATGSSSDIHDSYSFSSTFYGENLNERGVVMSEEPNESGGFDRTIRNATHKLIQINNGEQEYLYDLSQDPLEKNELINGDPSSLSGTNQTHYSSLKIELSSIESN